MLSQYKQLESSFAKKGALQSPLYKSKAEVGRKNSFLDEDKIGLLYSVVFLAHFNYIVVFV